MIIKNNKHKSKHKVLVIIRVLIERLASDYGSHARKFMGGACVMNSCLCPEITINYTTQQKFLLVNFTMDSSRVLYAEYHAISRFFTTRQNFEILLVKTT